MALNNLRTDQLASMTHQMNTIQSNPSITWNSLTPAQWKLLQSAAGARGWIVRRGTALKPAERLAELGLVEEDSTLAPDGSGRSRYIWDVRVRATDVGRAFAASSDPTKRSGPTITNVRDADADDDHPVMTVGCTAAQPTGEKVPDERRL